MSPSLPSRLSKLKFVEHPNGRIVDLASGSSLTTPISCTVTNSIARCHDLRGCPSLDLPQPRGLFRLQLEPGPWFRLLELCPFSFCLLVSSSLANAKTPTPTPHDHNAGQRMSFPRGARQTWQPQLIRPSPKQGCSVYFRLLIKHLSLRLCCNDVMSPGLSMQPPIAHIRLYRRRTNGQSPLYEAVKSS